LPFNFRIIDLFFIFFSRIESLVPKLFIQLFILSVKLISCCTITTIIMLELALVVNYSIAVVASAIIREDELLSIDGVHRIGSLP